MPRRETEALVAALEACADALERLGSGTDTGGPGSLPRLRPPSLGPALGRMAPWWPGAVEPVDPRPGTELLEMAAEFRDVALEVERGRAGRGWINSLLGRASRDLDPDLLSRVRAAALGVV